MRRLAVGLLAVGLATFALASSGCSDDDSNAGAAAGSAGSAGNAGSGGSAGEATYSVERVCEMLAAVTCARAAQCGLVLERSDTQLVCVDCTEEALELIGDACQTDLEGPKNAADVDRCLANTGAASCASLCDNASVPGCEVLDELEGDSSDPVDCDPACASG